MDNNFILGTIDLMDSVGIYIYSNVANKKYNFYQGEIAVEDDEDLKLLRSWNVEEGDIIIMKPYFDGEDWNVEFIGKVEQ